MNPTEQSNNVLPKKKLNLKDKKIILIIIAVLVIILTATTFITIGITKYNTVTITNPADVVTQDNLKIYSASVYFDKTEFKTSQNQDYEINLIAFPNKDLVIQGYKSTIGFDKDSIKIKDIKYLLGHQSSGISDSNDNLDDINSKGIISLSGEVSDPNGLALKKENETQLVKITFTALNTRKSLFYFKSGSLPAIYEIDKDNSINEQKMGIKSNLTLN